MRISWDFIRTFEAVAETGSLSAAARVLGLTQPTVGRHIDLLEAELKVPLFRRGRDGMTLTERGGELVESANEMVSVANMFERRAAGLDEDVSGTVRISANEIFGVMVLPALIAPFMQANPSIEIEIVVSNTAANLLRRDADIAVRMFRPTQNDLVARKVSDLPLGLYAHRDYLAAHPAPESLSDIRAHRCIGFDREGSMIQALSMLGEDFSRSDFAFRSDNILCHIEAIRAGVGIGVTHVGLASRWDGVERVLPDLPIPSLELWIACHADVRYNKRVRLVMDFLGECLRAPYGKAD